MARPYPDSPTMPAPEKPSVLRNRRRDIPCVVARGLSVRVRLCGNTSVIVPLMPLARPLLLQSTHALGQQPRGSTTMWRARPKCYRDFMRRAAVAIRLRHLLRTFPARALPPIDPGAVERLGGVEEPDLRRRCARRPG